MTAYLQCLEDQLNDQVDMHHGELAKLKQEIGVLAVKEEMDIVDFRSKERSRDLHEQLEACQHKVRRRTVHGCKEHGVINGEREE